MNILAPPDGGHKSLQQFMGTMLHETKKLPMNQDTFSSIMRANVTLAAVVQMQGGLKMDSGTKDAKELDQLMASGVWELTAPRATSGGTNIIAIGCAVLKNHQAGASSQAELSIPEAQDLSDRLFLIEEELKVPREAAIEALQQYIYGVSPNPNPDPNPNPRPFSSISTV